MTSHDGGLAATEAGAADLEHGAGVLGVGIGALAASPLRGLEVLVIAAGLVLHLWGMTDNHRAERGTPQPAWATATYWSCWVGLVALVGVMVVRALL